MEIGSNLKRLLKQGCDGCGGCLRDGRRCLAFRSSVRTLLSLRLRKGINKLAEWIGAYLVV